MRLSAHVSRRSGRRGQEAHHRRRHAPDLDAVRRSDAVRDARGSPRRPARRRRTAGRPTPACRTTRRRHGRGRRDAGRGGRPARDAGDRRVDAGDARRRRRRADGRRRHGRARWTRLLRTTPAGGADAGADDARRRRFRRATAAAATPAAVRQLRRRCARPVAARRRAGARGAARARVRRDRPALRWALAARAGARPRLGGARARPPTATAWRSRSIARASAPRGAPTTLSNYPLLARHHRAPTSRPSATAATSRTPTATTSAFRAPTRPPAAARRRCTLQLRDRELHVADATGQRRSPGCNIPVLKTTANTANTVIYVKYGDARSRRRPQNDERHLELELQGRLAPQSGRLVAADRLDVDAVERLAQRRPGACDRHRPHRLGRQHEQHDRHRLPRLPSRRSSTGRRRTPSPTRVGSRRPTRTGPLFCPSATTAPATRSSTSPSATTARPRTRTSMSVLVRDDTRRQLRRGQRRDDRQRQRLAPSSRSRAPAARITVYVDGASIGSRHGHGRGGSHHDRSTGNFQNIGREGNWVQSSYGIDRPAVPGRDLRRVPRLEHGARRRVDQDRLQHAGDAGLDLLAGAASSSPPAATARSSAARRATTATSSAATAAAPRCTVESGYTCVGRRRASARRSAATASSRARRAATTAT